jgi:hypothetical protein
MIPQTAGLLPYYFNTPPVATTPPATTPTPSSSTPSSTASGTITSSTGLKGLQNPLKVDTLAAFIQKILEIVTTIGIPIVAIFIIYSGFLFVKAQGDPGALKTAKETFLWTIIGAAILLASWILAKAICETVVQLGNTSTQCS